MFTAVIFMQAAIYSLFIIGCSCTELPNSNEGERTDSSLQQQVLQLQNALAKLETNDLEFRNEIKKLKYDNMVLKAKLRKINKENSENQNGLKRSNYHGPYNKNPGFSDVEALRNEIEKLKEDVSRNSISVSFTAYASQERDFVTGDTITFDQIVRNYGGHYDVNTSTFTCPVTGLYLFSVTARVEEGDEIRVAIRLAGEELVYVYSIDNIDQNTNLVVTECQAGAFVDVVCVEPDRMYGGEMAYSTFSGTLLNT